MPSTYEKAKQYMDKVVARVQQYLTEGFLSTHSAQLASARKVFVIEKKSTFALHIDFWYNTFFKKSVKADSNDARAMELVCVACSSLLSKPPQALHRMG